MFTTTAHRVWLPVTALTVLLAFAIAAPSAVADPPGQNRVREQLGEIGAWAVATPSTVRPDDRAGIRGSATPTALPQLGHVSDNGAFNWRDAGIGALAALVAMLLATSAALLALRRRRASQPIGGLTA